MRASIERPFFRGGTRIPGEHVGTYPYVRQALLKIKRSSQPLVLLLGLFALFSALTAILFWQWVPHLHSALLGPPEDDMQDFWNTWYASVAKKPDGFFLPT
jgi:hypothetical protein